MPAIRTHHYVEGGDWRTLARRNLDGDVVIDLTLEVGSVDVVHLVSLTQGDAEMIVAGLQQALKDADALRLSTVVLPRDCDAGLAVPTPEEDDRETIAPGDERYYRQPGTLGG